MPPGVYVRAKRNLMLSFIKYVNSDWHWTGCKSHKYGAIRINNKGYRAHRLSYELFNGPIPDGLEVLHECDDPLCVNPEHLHLGTQADNMREMRERGRQKDGMAPKGEDHPMAKLTKKQVIEIRELHITGLSYSQLAKKFNVSKPTIANIIKRRIWKMVD